jgi:hypothetical protein
MPSNVTVDGCDYTLALDESGDWWQVVTVDGDLIADFQRAEISEAVGYAYYLSDGDIVDGVNTEMFYGDWSPERVATWLVSTHPEV